MKTLREIVAIEDPACIDQHQWGGVKYCPYRYPYLEKYLKEKELMGECPEEGISCRECWDREVEE